jgi:signal transduction histidine kinase/ActR/RegA family two-component response regulator
MSARMPLTTGQTRPASAFPDVADALPDPSDDLLTAVLDLLDQGLFLLGPDGRLQLENAAGHRLRSGPPAGDAGAGAFFFDGGSEETRVSLDEALVRVAQEAGLSGAPVIASLARAGRQYELKARAGERGRVLITVRDVTAGLNDEVRRMQSEKLAAIGMLAAGVAHEINNPASFVLANTEALTGLLRMIEDKLRHDPVSARKLGLRDLLFEATAIVHESKEGMARIHRIVRDLHAFSRVEDDPRGVTDVNAAVESALTMLRTELRYRAQVERTLMACRPVRGSSARIGQVFLNLILNATHALPEGERRRNRIWVRSFDEGDSVVVEVEDNGPGIPAEVMPRIFDSFFTTKPAGVGTGLGLSICREIVRAARGTITVDSAPGGGARFRVRLPASQAAAVIDDPTPTPTPTRRRYRLLAIDDEVLLLKAYRRMLIDHHDIEVAAGGPDALALLEKDRRFDIILCDLQMPELSGADVYRTVAQRWPGLEQRIVVITGGAFSPEARKFLEEGMVTALNKPFQLEEILDVVDRRAAALRR